MQKNPKPDNPQSARKESDLTFGQMQSREIRLVGLLFSVCFSPLYVFFGIFGVLGNFLAGVSQFMYDKLSDTRTTLMRFYAQKTGLPKDGRRKK